MRFTCLDQWNTEFPPGHLHTLWTRCGINWKRGIILLQQKKMVIFIFHKETTYFTTSQSEFQTLLKMSTHL